MEVPMQEMLDDTVRWSSDRIGPAPSPPPDVAVPGVGVVVAGRYRLHSRIARGGMGTVWQAYDEVLMRWVAAKQYDTTSPVADLPRPLKMAQREGRIAGGFSMPGIVRIFDLAVHDGCPWLVMELLSGWSLATEIVGRGRLPIRRTAKIAAALLTVLDALHADGVIHRDVKPSNVQLTATDQVVLLDFGISIDHFRDGPERMAFAAGSPAFVAPEVFGGAQFSPATDLFALGVTLFCAAEGYLPFADFCPASATEPLPVLRNAGMLGTLIAGLLKSDPRARLTTAEAYACLVDVVPG
jgi:serine/threonine protein kinase